MSDSLPSMDRTMPGIVVLHHLPELAQNSCPSSWWCHSTISSFISSFSCCLQSFRALESLPVSQLFASYGQSIGASASALVLPMNIQGWFPFAAAAAKSLQSCPTLCDNTDGSRPGSPIPGILQARTLEWVAISFSNAWKWKVKVKSLSCVRLLATPWTAAYQAPPSMGFSRQEYWSGVPLPSPWFPFSSTQILHINRAVFLYNIKY